MLEAAHGPLWNKHVPYCDAYTDEEVGEEFEKLIEKAVGVERLDDKSVTITWVDYGHDLATHEGWYVRSDLGRN